MEIITTLIDWYQSLPQKERIMVLIAFFSILFIIYRLLRSEELDESNRVIVKFHSPLTWPKRFSQQIENNRAGYSEGNKRFLSFLWRGSKILYSIPPLLMSILLFVIAYVNFGDDDFWIILGAAFVCLLLFFWLVPKKSEDPFKNQ